MYFLIFQLLQLQLDEYNLLSITYVYGITKNKASSHQFTAAPRLLAPRFSAVKNEDVKNVYCKAHVFEVGVENGTLGTETGTFFSKVIYSCETLWI